MVLVTFNPTDKSTYFNVKSWRPVTRTEYRYSAVHWKSHEKFPEYFHSDHYPQVNAIFTVEILGGRYRYYGYTFAIAGIVTQQRCFLQQLQTSYN